MSVSLDGLISATVLPMRSDGSIDEEGLRRYIRWVCAQEPTGVAINVDTGETAHLTSPEKLRVLEVVKEELPAGVTCVAGLTGPSTELAVHQARDLQAAGADALLVFPIPAYFASPLDPRVPVGYHRAIAEIGVPIILFQLHPEFGGVLFEPETLRELASIDGVVGIKEASFDAMHYSHTVQIIRSVDQPISILTGNDWFIYESFLLGADGALLGYGSVVVRDLVELIRLHKAGKHEDAGILATQIQEFANVIYAKPWSSYRVRCKEALVELGVIDDATVRLPLLPLSAVEREQVSAGLAKFGLKKEA